MTVQSTTLGSSLERAYRHWRERGALLPMPPSRETAPAMTVAISRERGAGGSAVANQLAERLGWPLYDYQLVELIASDTGISERLLGQLDEHCPSWFTEAMQGLRSERSISGVGFALRLRKTLLALYCHGDCIVLGRGAAQVLPAHRTLRVRLIAPLEHRVQNVAERLRIDNQAAAAEIVAADRTRARFVKNYFGKDPDDARLYDLTIDTSRFLADTVIDPVLAALTARRQLVAAERGKPQRAATPR